MDSFFKKIFLILNIPVSWIPFFRYWFTFGLVVHVLCAIFSAGHHHNDEYYQILEFLNAKLGGTPLKELPWEYHHKMRSWMQPGLYFLIAGFFELFGVNDPFFLTFSFRLFSSLTGFFGLSLLSLCSFFFFKENHKRKWAVILLMMTWFIPYILARPSSEGMGTNAFIWGLSLLVTGLMQKKFPPLLGFFSGFFLGLSFSFRFQLGITVLFTWLWAIIHGRIRLTTATLMILGIFLVTGLQVVVDRWGYGTWVFSPWNYLYENLILDKASNWETFPWWAYFHFSFVKGVPPLGLLFIVGQVLFWIKRPGHILTWITLPLFIIHSSIAAKAMRYLFPVIIFTPLCLLETPALIKNGYSLLKNKWIKRSLYGLLVINIILLLTICFIPARFSIGFYRYVYRHNIKTIYIDGENPYHMPDLPFFFYKRPDLKLIPMDNDTNMENYWYFVDNVQKIRKISKIDRCRLKYTLYPDFLLNFNITGWMDRSRIWGLFYCDDFEFEKHI